MGAITAGVQSGWDLEAMAVGAVIGGVSGGAFSYASGIAANLIANTVANAALSGATAGAIAGGLNAYYYGGDVGQGILKGAFGGAALSGGISLLAYSATTMRNRMIAQSNLDRRNASGISAGHKGDKFKLAGGRYNAKDPLAISQLGGRQGGTGSVFGFGYKQGSLMDLMCEAYAGPHDFDK